MIPVMPNGLIAILASVMDITVRKYAVSVWSGSRINVLLSCGVGNRIVQGDWVNACIFVGILVTLFLLMWFLRDRILSKYYSVREREAGSSTMN